VKVLTLSEAKAKLSEIVDRGDRRNEPVIVSTGEYEGLTETIEIL
jgi:prevent-host-death family protein